MKVAITGGAGFVGSNLAIELYSRGHLVKVIDNEFLGKKSYLPEEVYFQGKDVRDLIAKDLEGHDVVFHEAALSSSPMFRSNPLEFFDVNVMGFQAVLEAARATNCKVVYASSSSVYNGQVPPHREFMQPALLTPYELVKYANEKMARYYFENFGVESVGLRYFSVYGEHEEHKGEFANLVSQFYWARLKGEQPVIFGDGSQVRDFIHVSDVVKANLLAAEFLKNCGGCRVFNVGTGVRTNMLELCKVMGEVLGESFTPKFVENPVRNYVSQVQAGTELAEKELGFKAQVSLREGIKRIGEYYGRL